MPSHPTAPEALDATWLRDVLASGGDARATRLQAIRTERIGVGYGLDGTLVRVTLLGPEGTLGTLVAKWGRPEIATVEGRFYREIAPRLEIALPRLIAPFGGEKDALLLLEDLAPARQGDAIVGASPAEAPRVVATIASFHARFWNDADDPAIAWLPHWGAHRPTIERFARENLPRFLARFGSRLSRGVVAHLERLPETLAISYDALASAPPTLVHNDLHLDNVLFRADGTPVLIDWVTAARGPGAVDLLRFLVEGMALDSRRLLEPGLRAQYLADLLRRGIAYDADRLDAHLVDALHVMLAAVFGFRDPATPGAPERLGPIVESLVTNLVGFLEDHVIPKH